MDATSTLADRYIRMLGWDRHEANAAAGDETCTTHLAWMCYEIKDNEATWPIAKRSRWLGFVQGALTQHGVLDVQRERDFSRSLFEKEGN